MKYKKNRAAFSVLVLFFVLSIITKNILAQTGKTQVLVETTMGNLKLVLYDQTPKHRDNFIKLVKEHYYDSVLFHRCIQNFMIQGGDPDSKKAPPFATLGEGGPGYTVPAEFDKNLFHKKGVLAAAREGDLDNPQQESSGSQFYIVQGKVFTDSLLKNIVAKRITKMKLFNEVIKRPENKIFVDKYKQFAKDQQADSAMFYYNLLDKKAEAEMAKSPLHTFTEEQIKAYTTSGGTPHLDGSYTVFGEVVEGMDVVEKIAAQKTDSNNRPLTDIRITRMSIIP